MAQSGSDSVRLLPSPDGKNVLAAKELAREVGAYLAAKYPALFVYHPGLPLSGYTGSLDVEQRGKDIPELVLTDAYLSAVQRDTSAPRAEVSTISFSKESEVGMDTKAHVRDERKIKMRFPLGTAEDCLEMIGSVVPDDVLLLLPSPDRGQEYVLIGGVTCTAGTWRLKDKIGMTLTEIHTSGHVPQYETKLRPGMDKFFARLQPDNLMARSNVGFQVIRNRPSVDPEELAHLPYVQGDPDVAEMSWATTAFGPENEWVHENRGKGVILAQSTGELSRPGQDPTEQTFSSSASQFQLSSQPASRVPVEEKVEAVEGDLSFDPTPFTRMEVFASATEEEQEKFVEHVQMRTERQSVRRLPLSGAVIFTVHTYVVPVLTMAQEWGVPARLSSALKSWPEDTFKYVLGCLLCRTTGRAADGETIASEHRYKGGPKYRDQLVTYLDRKHAHQLAKGLVVDKEKDRASYPL